ncbi:hypothetical protein [Rhodococcus sp. IEGM 1408]|uniref:hypothetical protein n=1 Tax=Rhodococcus sp. IEGM 1408 TaxID=3082220 RepID=UPI0029537F10|nr:hypothetical protein [Rhodococcus sp. IEGM 1408]MDV8002866.1 hypothetical protein [Rhodococcus sp. IEGM 1408]
MTTNVLATNEMKSNLAAYIKQVSEDPRQRVVVGAHRRPEAVLLSVSSELPERQLHTMATLAGRALGYELAEQGRAGSSLGECRELLSVLAARHRREDCLRFAVAVATVVVEGDVDVATVVRQIGHLIGDAVEPELDWADLAGEVHREVEQRRGNWQEGEVG